MSIALFYNHSHWVIKSNSKRLFSCYEKKNEIFLTKTNGPHSHTKAHKAVFRVLSRIRGVIMRRDYLTLRLLVSGIVAFLPVRLQYAVASVPNRCSTTFDPNELSKSTSSAFIAFSSLTEVCMRTMEPFNECSPAWNSFSFWI